ncbi:hypothetical protein [Pedobacter endophyticus]|uniref:Uncharacterized protein n=1 Tax=Pedobacter endophyticus TaxID=2789740 RepID=A0A7S9PZP8_9SPHI|nr:hypothetical protein [Pedobacter endophyticus]QPH40773.1 hypothetical protein IZT61_05775 [Pedobacter endophyticus]
MRKVRFKDFSAALEMTIFVLFLKNANGRYEESPDYGTLPPKKHKLLALDLKSSITWDEIANLDQQQRVNNCQLQLKTTY